MVEDARVEQLVGQAPLRPAAAPYAESSPEQTVPEPRHRRRFASSGAFVDRTRAAADCGGGGRRVDRGDVVRRHLPAASG